jgi:hypothetical protein
MKTTHTKESPTSQENGDEENTHHDPSNNDDP